MGDGFNVCDKIMGIRCGVKAVAPQGMHIILDKECGIRYCHMDIQDEMTSTPAFVIRFKSGSKSEQYCA